MAAAARIVLPPPHKGQEPLFYWNHRNEVAQALVAPCGTKAGKSLGSALWMAKEATSNKRLFCVWIAPTLAKCRVGYRYLKAMLNIDGVAECIDGLLEIRLKNGSFIKFLHGRDAEVTVEGEAIDRFIIDEAGKIAAQVWYSLYTTLTQTKGIGIITGTPRGKTWYYDLYQRALKGDRFFTHMTLRTIDSPYVDKQLVENAKRLLPKALYEQYYLAMFVSAGDVFGDLNHLWDESLIVPEGPIKFWIHPDQKQRQSDIFHGVDIAKKRDYTVFYSVNSEGKTVGFCRFQNTAYPQQGKRFEQYIHRYFGDANDNIVQFDCTGVGEALGDIFYDLDIDASFTPVTFTNKSKADMVTQLSLALEQRWLTAPRIGRIEAELSSYEVKVTKSGLHSYAAPEGEHDDIVSAMMLAVSAGFRAAANEASESLLLEALNGNSNKRDDDILNYVDSAYGDENDDDFFDDEDDQAGDFEFEGMYG